MNLSFIYHEIRKLGPQRVMVKSSPLFAVLSILVGFIYVYSLDSFQTLNLDLL